MPKPPSTTRRHHGIGTTVVRPEQAARYRLSGDRVLLHIDPELARQADSPGPFPHGLRTFGFRALGSSGDVDRLSARGCWRSC
ncbi:MAG: MaoC/PaaZ C-terminal domain-containing protein [Acidimicrobiia bacterium]|nr:MaoC/PaaZ C-terminal domain-containing protein [Acidimicrobiia bacterium]